MGRRSFLAAIAAFFALKPTTTLVAAGPECSTVAAVPAIDASMTLNLNEFAARWLHPAMVNLADSVDRQALLGRRYHYDRLEDYDRRFNPARLPV